ncbi:MAG: hypothetical protein KF774_18015 [Planctomyces sp.]|nr:hypothetical protein [Planctomyces sp.]
MDTSSPTQFELTPRERTRLDTIGALAGALGLLGMLGLATVTARPEDTLVRWPIRIAVVAYFAALALMLTLDDAGWRARTAAGRSARWLWTWGSAAYLVHVAMAFHFVHGWSHARAFAATATESGFGEGIYVSYLFTILWPLDAALWQLAPDARAARPRWASVSLHAFLGLIVFNGAVVFAEGGMRWAGAVLTAALAVWWRRERSRRRLIDEGPTDPSPI